MKSTRKPRFAIPLNITHLMISTRIRLFAIFVSRKWISNLGSLIQCIALLLNVSKLHHYNFKTCFYIIFILSARMPVEIKSVKSVVIPSNQYILKVGERQLKVICTYCNFELQTFPETLEFHSSKCTEIKRRLYIFLNVWFIFLWNNIIFYFL